VSDPRLELLERLRDASGALPPDLAALVAGAVGDVLEGAAESLDEALGIKAGPGQPSVASAWRYRERDGELRRAAARFFPHLRPVDQADRLAAALRRYASTRWPRERSRSAPPESALGTLDGALWRVLKLVDSPLSSDRIERILRAGA
jgi:hypothetical protein